MTRTRRAVLAGALGTVAGVIAARFAQPDAASAAAGDPLIMGSATNSAGTADTSLATTSPGTAMRVTQLGTGAAIRGSAVGPASIAGFFTATNGTGISGVTGRDTAFGAYGANDASTHGGGAAIRAAGQQNHGLIATTSSNLADAVRAVQTGGGTAVRATATTGVAIHAIGSTGIVAEATGTSARGVAGLSAKGDGVRGETYSRSGAGVHGVANVGDANDIPTGVLGETTTAGGIAVRGSATASGTGVQGESASYVGVRGVGASGVVGVGSEAGVVGLSNDPSAPTVGVKGTSASDIGTGTQGSALSATGATVGVLGEAASSAGTGVKGVADRIFGSTTGVHGEVASTSGVAVRADSTAATGNTFAVLGTTASTAGIGIYGKSTAATGNVYGVLGETSSDASIAAGVWGYSGATTGEAVGVFGQTNSTDDAAGVLGWSLASTGAAAGVVGLSGSPDGTGVVGIAAGSPGIGVYGSGSGNGYGVFSDGPAKVAGNLEVTGSIAKGGGGFRIDHPIDPANRYLSHSFVESPDMKNLYDGVATLDDAGEATVDLPEWFEALNREIRYQLTPIGEFAPLYVASTLDRGRFSIAGGAPGQDVSWQVTGIRRDAWAEVHRIPVEEPKSGAAKGRFLHPAEHGKKASQGIRPPAAARHASRAGRSAPKRPTAGR